jgi:hypothetical protein
MNTKQLLANFYMDLLSIAPEELFRLRHQKLYAEVRNVLSFELDEEPEDIQSIFERIASNV